MKEIKKGRRNFIRQLGYLALAPWAILVWLMIRKDIRDAEKELRIPAPDSDGIFFYNQVIVSRTDGELTLFSARCTHLGCRVNQWDGKRFICPCHGSEYDINGKVLKSPASDDLRRLDYSMDSHSGEIIVRI